MENSHSHPAVYPSQTAVDIRLNMCGSKSLIQYLISSMALLDC